MTLLLPVRTAVGSLEGLKRPLHRDGEIGARGQNGRWLLRGIETSVKNSTVNSATESERPLAP